MLSFKTDLRKIINFVSVGIFCLATLGGNSACGSSPEVFGDKHVMFIKSAVQARHKIIRIAYENIAQSRSYGHKTQGYNLITTYDEAGHRVVACKTWSMNNLLGAIVEGTNDLNLAFDSPKGFFVVTNTPENPLQGLAYTRAGDFMAGRKGFAVNSAGYYLMGWKLDEDESFPIACDTSSVNALELINTRSKSMAFRPTKELDVQVSLPATAVMGDTYRVKTVVIDSLGIGHNVLLIYTKTSNALEWEFSLTSTDAAVGGILQTSGANARATYTNITIQFNTYGRLVSYNGMPAEVTPPTAIIKWASTTAANSLLTLNFGAAGSNDAIRIMGDVALTVKNDDDGREISPYEGNFIGPEGDFYDVYRNSDKVKTYTVAVANFPAPNFLKGSTHNVFYETEESGNYVLGKGNENGLAKIIAGKLEDSCVDISSELINIRLARNENQVLLGRFKK